MASVSSFTTGSFWRDLRAHTHYRMMHFDKPGWRRFAFALVGLSLGFFLALYSTALRESGRSELAAMTALLALLITAVIAIKFVPALARRTVLERWLTKIEFEFTREGVVYLLVIVVIGIAGLNTGNNLLYIILASLLAGILVSGILSTIVLADLELEFVLPDHVFAEQPLISRLTVRNLKWLLPSFSLMISAEDQDRRRGKGAPAPRPPRILNEAVYVPYLPHRASAEQHVELRFPRRGRYTQEGFRISTRFPFSFLRKSRTVASRQEVLVLPNVQPTEEFYEILPLIGGEVESSAKGRGHDLHAIRDYQEGDSARHVDWKASAKAQQLKVREFTREDERRVVLVFDTQLPNTQAQTLAQFEKGVTFCACLAWHFYEIGAQMQFVTDGLITPMSPAAEIVYPVMEALALIEPTYQDASPRDGRLAPLPLLGQGFHIILTSRTRGSIPTNLWSSSYLVFIDSL